MCYVPNVLKLFYKSCISFLCDLGLGVQDLQNAAIGKVTDVWGAVESCG